MDNIKYYNNDGQIELYGNGEVKIHFSADHSTDGFYVEDFCCTVKELKGALSQYCDNDVVQIQGNLDSEYDNDERRICIIKLSEADEEIANKIIERKEKEKQDRKKKSEEASREYKMNQYNRLKQELGL